MSFMMSFFHFFGFVCLLIWQPQLSTSYRVMVIGANGNTGKKVVNIALRKGADVVAVTRSGELAEVPTYSLAKNKLKCIAGDVTSPQSITLSKDIDAVIYCASASKEGGSAKQVDCDGVIAMGKKCIESQVKSYVIVSSGAVSKPWSPVYLFLNLFGGIMKQKYQGEEAVRAMYRAPSTPKECGYTIVRPGGLTEEEASGVDSLELNQNDEKSGRVSRWDVAELCFEAARSSSASRVTLEVYGKTTGKPLSSVGLSNLFKMNAAPTETAGKFERRGSTWQHIFAGLRKDA